MPGMSRRTRGPPRRILPAIRERSQSRRIARRASSLARRIIPAIRGRDHGTVPLPRLVRSILVHLFRSETSTYNCLLDQVSRVYNEMTGTDPVPPPAALNVPDEEVIIIEEEEIPEPEEEVIIIEDEEASSPDPNEECSICLDRGLQATLRPCGHHFCGLCPAHLNPPRCPICRDWFRELVPLPWTSRSDLLPLDPRINGTPQNRRPVSPTLWPITEEEWNATLAVPFWSLLPSQGSGGRPTITWGPEDTLGRVRCNLCGVRVRNTPFRRITHSQLCERRL